MELTQEYLKTVFTYKEGILYWNLKTNKRIKKGQAAGCISNTKSGKRRFIRLDKKLYANSRLIFFLHNGVLPEFIDHKDRDSLNDRIENLRVATKSENNRNCSSAKKSSSKYLGVSLQDGKYWSSKIWVNGKSKHLGLFTDEISAAHCYNEAAKKYHGEFASLNII